MDIINCNTCGKFNEGREIGTYWICQDCNHSSAPKHKELEQEE